MQIDSNTVIEFLKKKWTNDAKCPYCNHNNWDVANQVFQLNHFSNGKIVLGGPVMPLVPVTCTNCGHTVIVNAISTGTISSQPIPQSNSDTQKG